MATSSRSSKNLDLLVPDGWAESDLSSEAEPPPKRKRLSLRKKTNQTEPRTTDQGEPRNRFLTSEEEAALSEKCIL